MTNGRKIAPFGSWESPINARDISSGGVGLGQVNTDGSDVYWIEVRPSEGGRSVIVRRSPNGATTDVNPPPFNARTRVHEYGGASYIVVDGSVYFSNFSDQRVYRVRPDSDPEPLTENAGCRYADFSLDEKRSRLVCVREDHRSEGEPENEVVALSLADGSETILASGSDFYASPKVGSDGEFLAFVSWNHPNMPWDGTHLTIVPIDDKGIPHEPQTVAGGGSESVVQPRFDLSPDSKGDLYFASDRSGWWNLHRCNGEKVLPVCEKDAEFAGPLWQLGASSYDILPDGRLICTYLENGTSHLAILDPTTGRLSEIQLPYSVIGGVHASGESVYFTGGSATEPGAIVHLDLATGETKAIKTSRESNIDSGYLSVPEPVEFPIDDGLSSHAFYYPPKNRDYKAPEGERPPLIVKSHGGPTSMTSSAFSLGVQFWTSRGFAVLDVNYGGSSGYGRKYRERLNGKWGIVDVADCANGAKYLAEKGLADGERMAITGGSAGGYTTLCALAFTDMFSAGASHYGVSDLTALAKETHKFESRYLDGLIGPYPKAESTYTERSPINHIDGLSAPVIFFQGLEDEVVPPNQAEMMVAALREKAIPVAYVPFAGEQHGFRRSENIERALEGELYFYSRIFGFDPADDIEPVEIENLG